MYQDTIIIYQDQGASFGAGGINRESAGAFVIALDAATGETRWRTERSASVGWGSPIAISLGDHDELIVSSSRQVHSYNPSTGEELWRCGGNLFEVIPTPVVGHGLVFCTSGRAGPTLAIRPGGSGDVTESHVVWKTTRGSPFVPSPLLYGDYLYTLNDMSSIITCLNATTGETVWQERLGRPRREGISASPVVFDDSPYSVGNRHLNRGAGGEFTDHTCGVHTFGHVVHAGEHLRRCLLYTSPSPRDLSTSRMPSSA